MKNITKVLLAVETAIILFAACGKEEKSIDVSDVKDMIFGSELPNILYYSKEKAIIDGSFGVAVYDLENSRLTDRITYYQMREWGMGGYGNYSSADGGTVYITDMRQIDGVTTSYVAYDVESKTASDIIEMTEDEFSEETFGVKRKHYDPAEYEKYFQKYTDNNCLIGGTAVSDENEFVFLIIPSGMLYDTQIVVCGDDGSEKVYRIFNEE